VTISELGSLAEIMGSIAVIITLVILVFQVRGARLELSSQMTREIKRDNNDAFHQLIQSPGLVDIHIRGQREYNNLSEAEKLTWLLWLFTWINQTEDAWMARNHGILDMEWVDAYMVGIARVLRSEGGRIAWPILRGNFERPFTKALEKTIREDDETFLDAILTPTEPAK
jgi:hypothetical protein